MLTSTAAWLCVNVMTKGAATWLCNGTTITYATTWLYVHVRYHET